MENGTTRERRRASSLPWDHVGGSESRRPSAYAHYKKLVHDFDRLEADLEQSRLEQEQLEKELERHQEAVVAHAKAEGDRELAAWERERDHRIEALCVHGATVYDLRKQQAALEEQEIRLMAELEVLNEKQQQANATDAKRVADLVHGRTSILELELIKGQMDLEFLTQVVSNARRKPTNNNEIDNGDAIHAVVGTIRQRRQEAFREATAQFQQRLQSFEQEKEALQRQADEIKWKKQRALQILSNNQQQVITGFFTTPRVAMQDPNPSLPSLDFSTILEGMNQPIGDVVRRLHDREYGRMSARRRLSDALAEATRNIESGPHKLETIQKTMDDRQQEALQLKLAPSLQHTTYDGRWNVETYRPDQYDVVYFLRSLVFEWMEQAVSISIKQPATELLEMEVRRYGATRAVLNTLEQQAQITHCSLELFDDMEHDVIREMAQSIHHELQYSANKVRHGILDELQNVLLVPSEQTSQQRRTKATTDQLTVPLTLRKAMLEAAWDEMKRQREPDLLATRRLPKLLMRPVDAEIVEPTKSSEATSPTKKRFGFRSGVSKIPSSEMKAPSAITHLTRHSDAIVSPMQSTRTMLKTDNTPSIPSVDRLQEIKQAERLLWERHMQIIDSSFASLATCAFITSIHLSVDGQLVALGTLDGEVMVFTLNEDKTIPPMAVRVSPPDKQTSSTRPTGLARITRLQFSTCSRLLLSYNQLKAATLWTLALPSTLAHSADCFVTEIQKCKPFPLRVATALVPQDLFLEPSVPAHILERDAPVAVARLQAASPVTVSAVSFFPLVSLTGESMHILCGASTGDILKCAISPLPKNNRPNRPQWLLGPTHQAAFEAPKPSDPQLVPVDKSCEREFFRSAHRQNVLFVSTIAPLRSRPMETRLVSVDQVGSLALWTYSRATFSGLGWFVPSLLYQLELALHGPSSLVGEILQIQLTPTRTILVLMVYFATTPGRLRFIQVDLMADKATINSVRMELDLVGTIPPRFALIGFRPSTTTTPRSTSARISARISARKGSRSDYLVLLMDNCLHILSLETGDLCRPAIPLHTNIKETRKGSIVLFNSIATSSQNINSTAIVAVAGEQHRQIRIIRFQLLIS